VFRFPVIVAKNVGGLESVCAKFKAQGVRLIATSSHKGTPLDQTKLSGPAAIFIGSEGAGLPRGLIAQMDETVAIPHAQQVESLNAGVAGSIVLYEAARQRRAAKAE
jgi:TrmH family RNA methyltransferase